MQKIGHFESVCRRKKFGTNLIEQDEDEVIEEIGSYGESSH